MTLLYFSGLVIIIIKGFNILWEFKDMGTEYYILLKSKVLYIVFRLL